MAGRYHFAIAVVLILITLAYVPAYGHDYPFQSDFAINPSDADTLWNISVEDRVELTVKVTNTQQLQIDAVFITQILNMNGTVESLQVSNVTILPDSGTEITNIWIPKHHGQVVIEGFLWNNGKDGFYQLAPKWDSGSFVYVGLKEDLEQHNMTLMIEVDQREVVASEPINGSLYLVNNGDHPESIMVNGLYGWDTSVPGSCAFLHASKLDNPIALPAGGKVQLVNDTIGQAPRHPGIYNQTWRPVMLSVENPDGEVRCFQVTSNTISINVTAPPMPDGVKLLLYTDKQVYNRNETIAINIYIENNSDIPFKLSEVYLSAYVKDSSKKEIGGTGTLIADYSNYPTVAPHSRYDLNGWLSWDQKTYLETGQRVLVAPGEYFIEAEFWSPFLKSDSYKIIIVT